MSQNLETVNRYLDGFRRNDHERILSCLTDDIKWTVFGAFQLTGKDAYDKAIDGAPEFIDPPELEVVRMIEQDHILRAALRIGGEGGIGGDIASHGIEASAANLPFVASTIPEISSGIFST